jgi:hypothetical protein
LVFVFVNIRDEHVIFESKLTFLYQTNLCFSPPDSYRERSGIMPI